MTTPRAFEIVPFTDIESLADPDNGPYFVADRDGYLAYRNFHFGRVLVPIDKVPTAPKATPTLWHDIDPPIPHQLIGQALSFFTAIYNDRKSEAMVDIVYDADEAASARRAEKQGWNDHGYRLFVPPQKASGGGVKCQRTPEHYRGQMVGTIHSHCNFSAFHSGTDTHDADSHDGLHITIGDVLKTPSIAIMVSVAKIKWDFKLEEISDGPLQALPHPTWWERYVSDPDPIVTHGYRWSQQKLPQVGAISRTQHHIQGPTKETPTIVGFPRDRGYSLHEVYSIEALKWRYNGLFNADDELMLDAVKDSIDEASDFLESLGIFMDISFIPQRTDISFIPQLTDTNPTKE